MDEALTTAIRRLVEPILEEHEIELVELACWPQGGELRVRLLVDRVGGVTMQDCTRLNQRIDRVLQGSNLSHQRYLLEVSSPGLDRPLVTVRDYARAVGEPLCVVIRREEGRFQEVRGQLLSVEPEAVFLKTSAGTLTIPLIQIQSAKRVIRF
jgi:ribosome maturation factor RimP